jgi:hypothetical protein
MKRSAPPVRIPANSGRISPVTVQPGGRSSAGVVLKYELWLKYAVAWESFVAAQ